MSSFPNLVLTCLVLTGAFSLAPVAALAQNAAPQSVPQSAPQAPATAAPVSTNPLATQNATVVEPNVDALKPPGKPEMTKPKWSEFPTAPKNVPTVTDFAGRVHNEEGDATILDSIGRSIVWEKFQPDAIKADAAARIDPSKYAPIDPEMTPEQTEALAQSLRAQAAPPPVAQ